MKYAIWTSLVAAVLMSTTTVAQTTTYTGPDGAWNNDSWNTAGNWDNGIPSGTTDAVIGSGRTAAAGSGATPHYIGSLTLQNNSVLLIGQNSGADDLRAFGTGTITMSPGSRITLRHGAMTFTNEISYSGDVTIRLSESSAGHHDSRTFSRSISGTGKLTLTSANNNTVHFNAENSFAELETLNGGMDVHANVSRSLGGGLLVIGTGTSLICETDNVTRGNAVLELNGSPDGGSSAKLVMNGDTTVRALYLDGARQPNGEYTAAGLGSAFMAGTGTLRVRAPGTVIILH